MSALHAAAKKGDPKELKKVIRKMGKNAIDQKDDYEQTPLHIACFEGHLPLVKYMVERCKANVEARDKNNWTPLHAAASGLTAQHIKICTYLLDRGADPQAKTNDGSSPLHYFVRMEPNDPLEFHRALERMANPTGETDREKKSQITKKTVNAQNRHGESPLHHASIKGREQSAIFLHHLGADVNLQNRYGETSLIGAIRSARPEMVRLLLGLGSDQTITSDAGSAMELAKSTGVEEIISYLAEDLMEREQKNKKKEKHKQKEEEAPAAGFGLIIGDSDDSDDEKSDSTSERGINNSDDKVNNAAKKFSCPSCGEESADIPTNFHAKAPALWNHLDKDLKKDCRLSLDLCTITAPLSFFEQQDKKLLQQNPGSSPASSTSPSSQEQQPQSTANETESITRYYVRGLIELAIQQLPQESPRTVVSAHLVTSSSPSPVPSPSSSTSLVPENQQFAWGVWVELKEEDFKKVVKTWNKEGREKDKSLIFLGRLATSLPCYSEDTIGLKVRLHTRPVGRRPWVEVLSSASSGSGSRSGSEIAGFNSNTNTNAEAIPVEHELVIQQKNGITRKHVQEMVEQMDMSSNDNNDQDL